MKGRAAGKNAFAASTGGGPIGQSDERLAKNEKLFRAVNERLEKLGDAVPWRRKTEFLCECSDTSCIEAIELEKHEYEHARSRPNVFFVVPGHELPTIETVIEEHDGYRLVEKAQT